MSWIRKISLQLQGGSGQLDLSQMQVEFEVSQAAPVDNYPNDAAIRIWNLSDSTAKSITAEYQKVLLMAGYEQGDFGVIFEGSIKQVRRGRMNAKDSFLDIFAADGDSAKFGAVNETLPTGWKRDPHVYDALDKASKPYDVTINRDAAQKQPTPVGPEGVRPKTMYGLYYLKSGQEAKRTDSAWVVDGGKMMFIPLDSYRKGQIVKLNSNTGLVNIPEATIEGIKVITLLNPKIRIGTVIQIDNADANQTTVLGGGYPQTTSLPPVYAATDADGLYYVLQVEHEGDTRGHDWYSKLVCWSYSATNQGISPYGWKVGGGGAGSNTSAADQPLPGSSPLGKGGIGSA